MCSTLRKKSSNVPNLVSFEKQLKHRLISMKIQNPTPKLMLALATAGVAAISLSSSQAGLNTSDQVLPDLPGVTAEQTAGVLLLAENVPSFGGRFGTELEESTDGKYTDWSRRKRWYPKKKKTKTKKPKKMKKMKEPKVPKATKEKKQKQKKVKEPKKPKKP